MKIPEFHISLGNPRDPDFQGPYCILGELLFRILNIMLLCNLFRKFSELQEGWRS